MRSGRGPHRPPVRASPLPGLHVRRGGDRRHGRRRRPGLQRRDGSGRHGLGPGDDGTARAQRRPRPAPDSAPAARRSGLADPKGAERSLSTHCEVAAMLAGRVGLEQPVVDALAHAYERWDGKGLPGAARGRRDPARGARRRGGEGRRPRTTLGDDPREWMSERRAGRTTRPSSTPSSGSATTSRRARGRTSGRPRWRPSRSRWPPSRRGRSMRSSPPSPTSPTSSRPGSAAIPAGSPRSPRRRRHAGLDDAACDGLRRAGLVHDLGRVAVENGIWDKPGPLTTSEWERVRLHPYFTERILARARRSRPRRAGGVAPRAPRRVRLPPLAPAEALSRGDRILAAADVFAALTADRPHRPALADDAAARTLEAEARRQARRGRGRLRARRRRPAHRLPHRAGRPTSPTGRWRCSA